MRGTILISYEDHFIPRDEYESLGLITALVANQSMLHETSLPNVRMSKGTKTRFKRAVDQALDCKNEGMMVVVVVETMPSKEWLEHNFCHDGRSWAEIFIRRSAELCRVPINFIDKVFNYIDVVHAQQLPKKSKAATLLVRGNAEGVIDKATKVVSRYGQGYFMKRFNRRLLQERVNDTSYDEYDDTCVEFATKCHMTLHLLVCILDKKAISATNNRRKRPIGPVPSPLLFEFSNQSSTYLPYSSAVPRRLSFLVNSTKEIVSEMTKNEEAAKPRSSGHSRRRSQTRVTSVSSALPACIGTSDSRASTRPEVRLKRQVTESLAETKLVVGSGVFHKPVLALHDGELSPQCLSDAPSSLSTDGENLHSINSSELKSLATVLTAHKIESSQADSSGDPNIADSEDDPIVPMSKFAAISTRKLSSETLGKDVSSSQDSVYVEPLLLKEENETPMNDTTLGSVRQPYRGSTANRERANIMKIQSRKVHNSRRSSQSKEWESPRVSRRQLSWAYDSEDKLYKSTSRANSESVLNEKALDVAVHEDAAPDTFDFIEEVSLENNKDVDNESIGAIDNSTEKIGDDTKVTEAVHDGKPAEHVLVEPIFEWAEYNHVPIQTPVYTVDLLSFSSSDSSMSDHSILRARHRRNENKRRQMRQKTLQIVEQELFGELESVSPGVPETFSQPSNPLSDIPGKLIPVANVDEPLDPAKDVLLRSTGSEYLYLRRCVTSAKERPPTSVSPTGITVADRASGRSITWRNHTEVYPVARWNQLQSDTMSEEEDTGNYSYESECFQQEQSLIYEYSYDEYSETELLSQLCATEDDGGSSNSNNIRNSLTFEDIESDDLC